MKLRWSIWVCKGITHILNNCCKIKTKSISYTYLGHKTKYCKIRIINRFPINFKEKTTTSTLYFYLPSNNWVIYQFTFSGSVYKPPLFIRYVSFRLYKKVFTIRNPTLMLSESTGQNNVKVIPLTSLTIYRQWYPLSGIHYIKHDQ